MRINIETPRLKRKYTKRSPKWNERAQKKAALPLPEKKRRQKKDATKSTEMAQIVKSEKKRRQKKDLLEFKVEKKRAKKPEVKINKHDQMKLDKKLKAQKEAFNLVKIAARDFAIKIANCKKLDTREKLVENATKQRFSVVINEEAGTVTVTPELEVSLQLKVTNLKPKKEAPKEETPEEKPVETVASEPEVIEPEKTPEPDVVFVDPSKLDGIASGGSMDEPTDAELEAIENEQAEEDEEFEDEEDEEEDDIRSDDADEDLADYRREFFGGLSDSGNGFDD